MAYHIKFSARAKVDLDIIYSMINADFSIDARRWFNGLEEAILSLSSLPYRCNKVPDKEEHVLYYGKGAGQYHVFFEIREISKTVMILHIRHSARMVQ